MVTIIYLCFGIKVRITNNKNIMKRFYFQIACTLSFLLTLSIQSQNFTEGFENGITSWNNLGSHSQYTSTYLPAVGTYSLQQNGGGTHNTGLRKTISSYQPNYISYYVRTANTSRASGYTVLEVTAKL